MILATQLIKSSSASPLFLNSGKKQKFLKSTTLKSSLREAKEPSTIRGSHVSESESGKSWWAILKSCFGAYETQKKVYA